MTHEAVHWRVSDRPQAYPEAVAFMERRVADIRLGSAPETVWLLEHPPLYTTGTSARADEVVDPRGFPVIPTGRGGRTTYHGPGQRVAYVMVDLRRRGSDIRAYVRNLETWLMATLGRFGVEGERRDDRVGIWVRMPGGGEAKVAAIGVRVRRWVSYHGVSLNVCPDLTHFDGIVPCGVTGHGVTSLKALGVDADMARVDAALMETWAEVFGADKPILSATG